MQPPSVTARCSTCFRTEIWAHDGTQVVTLEGGQRRPPDPAWSQTWDVLRAWKTGGPKVVGTCDLCAQPMVSTDAHAVPATGWTLELPGATVTVGEWLTITRDGESPERASLETVDALVGEHPAGQRLREFIGPVSTLPFLGILAGLVLLVVILWTFTANFFFTFIWNGFTSGGFNGPGYG